MPTLRCPFRLLTSHGYNEKGFQALQQYRITGECHTGPIQCLGLQLNSFVVTAQSDNRYHLEAAAPSLTESETLGFLDRLEVAFTAHFGAAARNAYYGTPYVEFDRFNLELVIEEPPANLAASPTGTVTPSGQILLHDKVVAKPSDKLSMRAIENCSLSSDAVASLAFNPLRQLYANGLRATTAESKFFHWFIILEEFLEKSESLNSSFTALFSDHDQTAVRDFADKLEDERKKGDLCDVLKRTLEARHEKLVAILTKLGISTLTSLGGAVAITPELCQRLIVQRNKLFHRGEHIDDRLLYDALFPIVTKLAACSDALIALR